MKKIAIVVAAVSTASALWASIGAPLPPASLVSSPSGLPRLAKPAMTLPAAGSVSPLDAAIAAQLIVSRQA